MVYLASLQKENKKADGAAKERRGKEQEKMSYQFLLELAIILLGTKLLGILSKQIHLPQVVGALIAGIILGPAVLGVMEETEFLANLSEVGVIVMMFVAGLETDVDELKKSGKASVVIALLGVLIPLGGGFLVGWLFTDRGLISTDASSSLFLQNVFLGVILTATSVTITVETLKELGKLQTRSGNAILGAAIIDDVLGIIALTVITGMADTSVNIGIVLLKILAFFVFSAVVGFLFFKFFIWWSHQTLMMHRHAIIAFVFCLLMSYCAEEIFGVADITGAYIAGMIISMTQTTQYLTSRFDTLSYMFLSPVFFISVGLKMELPAMSSTVIAFSVLLIVVAVLTKIVGCGFGARICGYQNYTSLQIGVGMVSRGEVALIVANQGLSLGLLGSEMLGPVILMVLATTVLTPIMQKVVYTYTPHIEIGLPIPGRLQKMRQLREIRETGTIHR